MWIGGLEGNAAASKANACKKNETAFAIFVAFFFGQAGLGAWRSSWFLDTFFQASRNG
jgi:hypothetical protein